VIGLSMLDALSQRVVRLHATGLAHSQHASSRSGTIAGATRCIRLLVQCGVMTLSTWLVLEHSLSPGAMFAASILSSKALAPVEQLVVAWRGIGPAKDAWCRLRRQLNIPATIERLSMPEGRGGIEIDAATVRTADGRKLLDGVTVRLQAGTCTLVVGPSGAGKSTFCRLLAGTVLPDQGEVRLDGTPLRRYRREDLSRAMGYLPQEVGLFAGTVAENIARMAVEPESSDIFEAAARAQAHELIQRLPEGYETRLEDGGFPLSGGQRQRIGLARALYGAPKLLILDEPNANLDAAGENALIASLAELKAQGTTIVIVTHRPHLSRLADMILVVDGGRIARFGLRDEVLPTLIQPARAA
jgi:ATP-binding cassette subfamily C protein/ATP-binding cassette subfamily C exporter for protease/lipase/ATP-binding cassette subfamily C protein EexD